MAHAVRIAMVRCPTYATAAKPQPMKPKAWPREPSSSRRRVGRRPRRRRGRASARWRRTSRIAAAPSAAAARLRSGRRAAPRSRRSLEMKRRHPRGDFRRRRHRDSARRIYGRSPRCLALRPKWRLVVADDPLRPHHGRRDRGRPGGAPRSTPCTHLSELMVRVATGSLARLAAPPRQLPRSRLAAAAGAVRRRHAALTMRRRRTASLPPPHSPQGDLGAALGARASRRTPTSCCCAPTTARRLPRRSSLPTRSLLCGMAIAGFGRGRARRRAPLTTVRRRSRASTSHDRQRPRVPAEVGLRRAFGVGARVGRWGIAMSEKLARAVDLEFEERCSAER